MPFTSSGTRTLEFIGVPSLTAPPPPVPGPQSAPRSPTSAPTDPPTSCHCLGWNPSSVPAAWRALPSQGAAGPQGCPLMPRRVGGPGLKAELGPPASTAWACLSASCPLQKPGELIKNRWAKEEAAAADLNPSPSSSPSPSPSPNPSPSSSRPSPQLQTASSCSLVAL